MRTIPTFAAVSFRTAADLNLEYQLYIFVLNIAVYFEDTAALFMCMLDFSQYHGRVCRIGEIMKLSVSFGNA